MRGPGFLVFVPQPPSNFVYVGMGVDKTREQKLVVAVKTAVFPLILHRNPAAICTITPPELTSTTSHPIGRTF
ncbi:MAG: hypothetical protein H6668_01390 [Ardenticatenaceae bacterium]|nr:hypothetical protein [Ardenticatenaceae bacterium]